VSSIRQDSTLAFGQREFVNAVEPESAARLFAYDFKAGTAADVAALGTDGAIVDEGWAKEHQLGVGDRFTLKSGASSGLGVKGHRGSWIVTPAQQR
jgi:putative ABC transport system permease protein